MSEPTLFRLHLGSALRYEAFTLAVDPLSDSPSAQECVWLFDPRELLSESWEAGPRLRSPLPPARFSGLARASGTARRADGPSDPRAAKATASLPAGDYLFSQWRKTSYPQVEKGFEEFIRQVWWEGEKTEGPWILRIVAEDGDTAYQGLRMISKD
ncbi:MAG: hypothetical protein ACYC1A_04815 [Spirochaetales bacterium]